MERYIYVYRITVDSGNAPCVFTKDKSPSRFLTLTCCKPNMRRTIGKRHADKIKTGEREVYLFGIYNKKNLLYAAKITDVLTYEEYFSSPPKYSDQRDQIYDFKNGDFTRNSTNRLFHPKGREDFHTRDKNGGYALICACFAYFGVAYKEIDTNLLVRLHKGIGHKPYHDSEELFAEIMKYVASVWDLKTNIIYEPNDPLTTENDKDCGNSPLVTETGKSCGI